MSKKETLLEMVRGIRQGIKDSPGLSHAPFSDEGWEIIENALCARAEVEAPKDVSGQCPHCGKDVWTRCIPPYDFTKCSFYKKRDDMNSERKEGK